MRAKKLISIALLAVLGSSAQAQIVSSKSDQVVVTQKIKKPSTIKWNLRLGYSFDVPMGGIDVEGTSGFDASLGISKSFGNNWAFWGVEAGAMTYDACLDDNSATRSIGICVTPRIGVRFPIGREASFNLYGGPYIGYRFKKDDEYNIYSTNNDYTDSNGHYQYAFDYSDRELRIKEGIDAGINIGAELFVSKNFFFDIHFKKGLTSSGRSGIESVHYDSGNSHYTDVYDNFEDISFQKIVLGLGFQF